MQQDDKLGFVCVERYMKWFVFSAGILLLITGLAKIIGALGSAKLLDYPEPFFGPIFGFKFRHFLFITGCIELVIAWWCIFMKASIISLLRLLVCISTNFLLYRIVLYLIDWHRPCSCLGNLTDSLNISPHTADAVMKIVLAYIFGCSCVLLFFQWWIKIKK